MLTHFRVNIFSVIFSSGYPTKNFYAKNVLHESLHFRSFENSNYYYNTAMAGVVYQRACCVHGYHVYGELWEAAIF